MNNCIFYLTLLISLLLVATCIPVLEQVLLKSGFHRDVVTVLKVPASLLPDVNVNGDVECFLLFTETIPSGAYLDPFQINSLKPHGGPDVLLTDAIDVEKAEFESTDFQALVFSNLSNVGDTLLGGYTLPVHLRYHAVSKQDYVNVTFNHPEISVRCTNKKLGMPHHGYHGQTVKQKTNICTSSSLILCEWTVIHYHTDTERLSATVPVGKSKHYFLATIGTVIITLGACIVLLYNTLSTGERIKES